MESINQSSSQQQSTYDTVTMNELHYIKDSYIDKILSKPHNSMDA